MNYRHAFHAGNFADVLKHLVLALCIHHLKRKPAAFRVIDTHAGVGMYDLGGDEASRTGEWRDGIGRLIDRSPSPDIAEVLSPYLDVVRACNDAKPGEQDGGWLNLYPGSPEIVARLMRDDDRLVANELHPTDRELLSEHFVRDGRVKVMGLDGWTALKSLLPPKERRGLVLVDPPFEVEGELARMVQGLQQAAKRFATGVFLFWYPIKDPGTLTAFKRDIALPGLKNVVSVELMVRGATDPNRLNGSGLIIANVPYGVLPLLETVLPFLSETLQQGAGASFEICELRGET